MFVSFQYITGDYDSSSRYIFGYNIVDSDFEESGIEPECIAAKTGCKSAVSASRVFVEIYRKRNLPVVPNLILFWRYMSDHFGYAIDALISQTQQHNPFYPEYEDEINKYLLLQ